MASKTIYQIDRNLSGTTLVNLANHYFEGQDSSGLTGSYKIDLLTIENNLVSGITDDITSLSTAISTNLSIEAINRYNNDQSLSTAIINTGAVTYKGTWDARTVGEGGSGTPPVSGVGYYYIVNISGSTPLTGITGVISNWQIGDWAVNDGTYWDKIDNSTVTLVAAAVTYTNSHLPAVSNVQQALDSGITYVSSLDPSLQVPSTVGGIVSTTTVGSLTGKTFTQMFDSLLFPTVLAYIFQGKSSSLGGVTSATVEVGTPYAPVTTATYNPGVIKNGDGSTGPNLTGNANNYTFRLPNATIDNSFAWATNSTGNTFSSYNVAFGSNTWSVTINHDAGTGLYYDNKGNPVTNLDGSRVSGSVSANSGTITARRKYWWGVGTQGTAPTNSAGVRALPNTNFLSSTNTGVFYISIPIGVRGVWFFIPAGHTVQVNYQESLDVDVTITFLPFGSISVNDAAGVPQSYESYVTDIGGTGYPITSTYRVTIT